MEKSQGLKGSNEKVSQRKSHNVIDNEKKLVAVMKSKRTRIRSVWLRHLKSPITSRKGKNRLNKKNSQKKVMKKKPFGSHEPKRTRSEFGCGTP